MTGDEIRTDRPAPKAESPQPVLRYEKPVLVPLGRMAAEGGSADDCLAGSAAADDCKAGSVPVDKCGAGVGVI